MVSYLHILKHLTNYLNTDVPICTKLIIKMTPVLKPPFSSDLFVVYIHVLYHCVKHTCHSNSGWAGLKS